jgi:type I restriction enzyme S subunit
MSELYELPDGWEWTKLGEICNFIRGPFGGSLKKQIFRESGNAVYEQSHAIHDQFEKIRYFIDDDKFEEMKRFELKSNSLIMSCSGTIGKVAIVPKNIKKGIINQALLMLTPSNKLNKIFLKLLIESSFFQTLLSENSTGAAIANVASVKVLKQIYIPLPPLQEQKRIVAKLDTLFEKIDRAIALHQKNMDEADAFMGSVLNDVFGELEEKYDTKPISELFKIKSGKLLSKKNMIEDGDYNVYGGNGINGKYNQFNLTGKNVIIGRVGALCGNVRYINESMWLTDNAFYISDFFIKLNKEYLAQMLLVLDLGSTANQSAQPVISYKSIKILKIPVPPLRIQQKTVTYLDAISQKTEKLKQVQKEKMEHLTALKSSILDQAFKGKI